MEIAFSSSGNGVVSICGMNANTETFTSKLVGGYRSINQSIKSEFLTWLK